MEDFEKKEQSVSVRSEQVQEIIERIPTNFGIYVTAIVAFVFVLLLFFGWAIKYPDVVSGEIVINSNTSPIKLVAEVSGKLKLNLSDTSVEVNEGQVIAYLENATNPKNVYFIDSLLKLYNPASYDVVELMKKLPKNFSIGELNEQYFTFVNSLEELINYQEGKLLDKQYASLKRTLMEQNQAIEVAESRLNISLNSLEYAQKIYDRYSLLFSKRIISEAELDQRKVTYNTSLENHQNNLTNTINARQQALLTQSRIQEIEVQNPEKKQEIMSYVLSSYNKFLDGIKIWEQKYVFKAPFSGKVQYLKFWTDNQFVQAGEQIFTVIPKDNDLVGQVLLPNQGAGKIETDQEVIIKLYDYPYNEYGAVKGVVKEISLTTSATRTEQGEINNYLVIVDFPERLKTSYGAILNSKIEARGIAEIITNDRKLIERLFDNLKYRTK